MQTATLKQAQELLKLVSHQNQDRHVLQQHLQSGLLSAWIKSDPKAIDHAAFHASLNACSRAAEIEKEAKRKYPNFSLTPVPSIIDPMHTLETAIAVGRYDYCNSYITSENFPPFRSNKSGVCNLHLAHFDVGIDDSDDDASKLLQELDRLRLQQECLPEGLAVGSQYPDYQLQFPIVIRGGAWRGLDGRLVCPVLDRDDVRRDLRLYCVHDGWGADVRFLVSC